MIRILLKQDEEASNSAAVSLGIVCILSSMVCLGTWPAVMRLCTLDSFPGAANEEVDHEMKEHGSRSRFFGGTIARLAFIRNRYGQDRHPCHVYLDYAISYVAFSSLILPLAVSLIVAATKRISDFSNEAFLQTHYDLVNETRSAFDMEDLQTSGNDILKLPSMDQVPLILIAMLGGSLLAVGNITMQWSTTAFHAPLTTVLALQGSTCVVIGTYWNYKLQPEKTGRPSWLIIGVSMFICAIICSVIAQRLYVMQTLRDDPDWQYTSSSTNNKPVRTKHDEEGLHYFKEYSRKDSEGGISLHPVYPLAEKPLHEHPQSMSPKLNKSYGSSNCLEKDMKQFESDGLTHQKIAHRIHVDTPNEDNIGSSHDLHLSSQQHKHGETLMIKYKKEKTNVNQGEEDIIPSRITMNTELSPKEKAFLGIAIALFGGVCFGFFSPFFNISVNDPFHWSQGTTTQHSKGLSVTFANSCFGIAFTLSSIVWNAYLMKNPPPSTSIIPSSIKFYLEEPWCNRRMALLSGTICALGNTLQFQGGSLAGFAAADIVQAFPLVATIWDIFIFEEFASATYPVVIGLLCMYATYICGILFLAGSIAE